LLFCFRVTLCLPNFRVTFDKYQNHKKSFTLKKNLGSNGTNK
jgi:hypothetical protein